MAAGSPLLLHDNITKASSAKLDLALQSRRPAGLWRTWVSRMFFRHFASFQCRINSMVGDLVTGDVLSSPLSSEQPPNLAALRPAIWHPGRRCAVEAGPTAVGDVHGQRCLCGQYLEDRATLPIVAMVPWRSLSPSPRRFEPLHAPCGQMHSPLYLTFHPPGVRCQVTGNGEFSHSLQPPPPTPPLCKGEGRMMLTPTLRF